LIGESDGKDKAQMPALNTPQFDWVKSRLPRKARPMGTVYQPEVAAEALVYAAHHRRREIYVGWPTVEAIVGNKIMPGYGDHYLAGVGYDGQQYDGAADPNRPNNLWEPVDQDKDHGAHGDFDREAHAHSVQLWSDLHRDWLLLAGAGIAGAVCGSLLGKVRNHGPAKHHLPTGHLTGYTERQAVGR
jgi:hypothetical protein